MGFDVTGRKPDSQEGKYFRASVWYWHPLADYLTEIAPATVAKIKYLHSNNGDGLGPEDAVSLADALDDAIASGHAEATVRNRADEMNALRNEPCEYCEGTGTRAQRTCNVCDGKGVVRPSATWYVLDMDSIREFAVFARHSGGFEVW